MPPSASVTLAMVTWYRLLSSRLRSLVAAYRWGGGLVVVR